MKNDFKIMNHKIQDDSDIGTAVWIGRQAMRFDKARMSQARFEGAQHGIESFDVTNLEDQLISRGERGQFTRLFRTLSNRFFDEEMFSGAKKRMCDLIMTIRRSRDRSSVDQFAKMLQRCCRSCAIFFADGGRPRAVCVVDGGKFDVGHLGVEARVVAADVSDANDTDAKLFNHGMASQPQGARKRKRNGSLVRQMGPGPLWGAIDS